MITQLEDANEFFRIKGYATQLLVYAPSVPIKPMTNALANRMNREGTQVPSLQIENRPHIYERLRSGYGHKGGIFIVLYVILVALSIPAFLVTSGFGLREIGREIGVMKAMGWKSWEVVEKVALENVLISVTAVSVSILLSMAWTKGLNGILIAQFYIAELGLIPTVDIPSRYLPSHYITPLIEKKW